MPTTGSIEFQDDKKRLGVANVSSGRATLTTSLTPGVYKIQAKFLGSEKYASAISIPLVQDVKERKLVDSDTYGLRSDGVPFRTPAKRITAIGIRSNQYVHAIRIQFVDGSSPFCGNSTSGTYHELRLFEDERVVRIDVRSGAWLDAITFYTNKETLVVVVQVEGLIKFLFPVTKNLLGFLVAKDNSTLSKLGLFGNNIESEF